MISFLLLLGYIIGFCFAYGFYGGIREEMEGIEDFFLIVFWPVFLVLSAILFVLKIPYKIGKTLSKK